MIMSLRTKFSHPWQRIQSHSDLNIHGFICFYVKEVRKQVSRAGLTQICQGPASCWSVHPLRSQLGPLFL